MSALDAVSGRSEPSAREGGSVCESRVYLGDVSVVQYLAASMLTVTEGVPGYTWLGGVLCPISLGSLIVTWVRHSNG